jgi:type III pantothenate kinase
MLLCLDVGNTQVFGGVVVDGRLKLHFRHDSQQASTSDQLGIFLRVVLRENNIDPASVTDVAICSVVPSMDYSMRAAILKYFNRDPFFLTADKIRDLTIHYINPQEVGADRLATAVAASIEFPQQDVIVVDLGTATTLEVITADKQYLGGAILPGIRLSMEALQSKTAKLSSVSIIKPKQVIGKTTIESLQSGLYYGQMGMIRELIAQITRDIFNGHQPLIIGTGGFAHLYEKEYLFDHLISDLVLTGLCHVYASSFSN